MAGHFGGRGGNFRNAFGNRRGWNRFALGGGFGGGYGWGGGWGGWGGWAGPVFWPFLLGDIFSFALWPDYYDPFWAYGSGLDFDYSAFVPDYGYAVPDDIYGNIYSRRYASTGSANHLISRRGRSSGADVNTSQIQADVMQSCGGIAPGVTSFPIERIRQAIRPTGDQARALDDLATASSRATGVVNASCPGQAPLTPLGRLDAVERRLDAMIQAIQIVHGPLAALYDSLSDEQRQRLDAIGAQAVAGDGGNRAAAAPGDLAALCGRQAEGFTKLPVQQIERIVAPKGQQENALERLKQVSAQAADELRSSCPAQIPNNPVARLDAMSDRLHAMLQATKPLRPALGSFYASLSDEQKAQFNTMGQQNAEAPGGGR
jgi:LTXXQ motif family protein